MARQPFNSHNRQLRHSPSSSSEDSEDEKGNGSGSISAEDNLASTARTTPAALHSAPLKEPQLPVGPKVIDANYEWEVCEIITENVVKSIGNTGGCPVIPHCNVLYAL